MGERTPMTRRTLLGGAVVGAATLGMGLGATPRSGGLTLPSSRKPGPGPLADPTRPVATDLIQQIENIVIVMMENPSFDNVLGLL
jgi:phospholipase C